MPVRSLNSPVLKWPDREEVVRVVRSWASRLAESDQKVRRVGLFGSLAKGTWAVGSDIDIVVVLSESSVPFFKRTSTWPTEALPVSADVLAYTESEWEKVADRFGKEIIWIFPTQDQADT
jgi:predicted nucleotidyltransferase